MGVLLTSLSVQVQLSWPRRVALALVSGSGALSRARRTPSSLHTIAILPSVTMATQRRIVLSHHQRSQQCWHSQGTLASTPNRTPLSSLMGGGSGSRNLKVAQQCQLQDGTWTRA